MTDQKSLARTKLGVTYVTSERCGGCIVAPHEPQNWAYGWLLARHLEQGNAVPGAAGCKMFKYIEITFSDISHLQNKMTLFGNTCVNIKLY